MSAATDPDGAAGPVQIVIDTTSPVPAVEQIQDQVRRAVDLGHLTTGTRLATIRRLAGHLGVSNGVVARAYRCLEDEGVLRTAGRGGTTVAAAPTLEDVDHARCQALGRAAGDYAATAVALGVATHSALDAARAALDAAKPSTAPGPGQALRTCS